MNYKTIFNFGMDEFIVNKSRFIGYSLPCTKESEALEFSDKIRKEHPQAAHHCYAYYVEEEGTVKKRYNDDGEPQGTAGLPILSVIEKEELVNLCVIAVRYYGGVKLGKGGLVRAYTKTASIAVEAGKIITMQEYAILKLEFDYTISGKLDFYFKETSANISPKEYGTGVSLLLFQEMDSIDEKIKDLNDITSGNIKIEEMGRNFFPTDKNGKIIEVKL